MGLSRSRIQATIRALPEAWAVLLLDGLFLLVQPWVPEAWTVSLGWQINLYQMFATVVSLANFMLSGAMAVRLLGLGGSWLTRLPTYLAAAVGLWSIPGLVVAFTASMDLGFLMFWGRVITLALAAAAFLRVWIWPFAPQGGPGDHPHDAEGALNRPLLILAALVLVGMTVLSINGPVSLDDNLQLGYVQDDLVASQINADEPALGAGIPPNTRGSLTTWPINLAAIVQPTDLPAQQVYWLLRTPLVLLDLLALYLLVLTLFGKRNLAVFTVLLFCLVAVIQTNESDAIGFGLFARTAQDKFVVRYLLYPTTLAWCLSYLRAPNWRAFALTGIMITGLSATHPMGMVLLGISLGGLGLVHLIVHLKLRSPDRHAPDENLPATRRWWLLGRDLVRENRTMLEPYVLLALLSGTGLILPLVQQASPDAPIVAYNLTDTSDPSLWFRINLVVNNFRLFIGDFLGPRAYIVHPRVFLNSVIVLPALMLPFIWRRRPVRQWLELMVGVFLLNPILLLVPPIVQLIGDRATPWLLYRFAWPLTLLGPILLAWATWMFLEWLGSRVGSRSLRAALPAAGLLAVAVVFSGQAYSGIRILRDVRQDPGASRCRSLQPVLSRLPELAGDGAVVLSTPDMDMCIPANAANAYPIEYFLTSTLARFPNSRLPEAEQRLADAYEFRTAKVVDQGFMDILTRWDVALILIRQDHPIVAQLGYLPELFELELSRDDYVIYRVRPGNGTDVMSHLPVKERWSRVAWQGDHPLIAANSLWSAGAWEQALTAYQDLAEDDAPYAYLARLGMGRAHLSAGRAVPAVASLERATQAQPGDVEGWYELGEARYLTGDYAAAAAAWNKGLEALSWHPQALNRLGDAYLRLGQEQNAKAAYRLSVASESEVGSSFFHRNLGLLYLSAGLYPDAASALDASLSIQPSVDVHLLLSEVHWRRGDYEAALQAARAGKRAEIWSDLPHLMFAKLALDAGDFGEAAQQLRTAATLNPRSDGVIRLANLWRTVEGPERALERLERTASFKLGFAEGLLAASRQEIALGRITNGMGYARLAWTWEPVNSGAAVLVGDIFRHIGLAEEARAYYEDALEVDRTSYNAYLGLAALARTTGDWGTARGWTWRAATAAPYSSGPVLALGDIDVAEGQLAAAEAAFRRGIAVNPFDSSSYIALAELQLSRGNTTDGLEMLKTAIEVDPSATSAYRGLASAYTASGRFDEALATLNAAIQRAPGEGANYAALAALLRDLGDLEHELRLLRLVEEVDPGYRPGRMELAERFLELGRWQDAETVYVDLIEQAPEFEDGYVGLGLLRERQGRPEEAVRWYLQGIDAVSRTMATDTRIALADLYARQGQWEQARAMYQSASDNQPLLPDGYVALAEFELSRANPEAAHQTMLLAEQVLPAATAVDAELARTHAANGDVDAAESVHREAVAQSPQSPEVAIARSNFYLATGRPNLALDAVLPLGRKLPGNAAVASQLVAVQIAMGQPSQAVVTAERLVSRYPGMISAWLSLGQALDAGGQPDRAVEAYRRAVDLEPQSPSTLLALGRALLARDRSGEAVEVLARATEADIRANEAVLAQGELAMHEGDIERAKSLYQMAAARDLAGSAALLELGRVHQQLGDLEAAGEAYERAMEASPSTPGAYLAQAELRRIQGNDPAAHKILALAAERLPGSCQAQQNLARMLINIGQEKEARARSSLAVPLADCITSPYFDLGNLAGADGNHNEAIDYYLRAIDAFPSDPLPYAALADTYQIQDRAEEAEAVFELADMQIPSSTLMKAERVRALLAQGDYASALATAQRATMLAPTDPSILITKGNVYLLMAEYDRALDIYLAAADTDRSSSLPWLSIGSLKSLRADRAEAEAAFLQAIEREPSNPSGYVELGDLALQWNDLRAAEDWFRQGETVDRRRVEASIALSEVFRLQGRHDDALDQLRNTLDATGAGATPFQEPAHPLDSSAGTAGRVDVYRALADLHRSRAEWSHAEEALMAAIDHAPGRPEARYDLSRIFQVQGLMAEARAQIEQAIQVAPGASDGYVRLGDWHRARAVTEAHAAASTHTAGSSHTTAVDWSAVEQAYLSALEAKAANVEARLKLADVYLALGDQSRAEAEFDEAIAMSPASPLALTGLARLQMAQGQLAQSQAELEQARQLQPNDPDAYIAMGDAFLGRGLWLQAKAEYQAAIAASPRSSEAHIALGDWYSLQGDPDRAMELYRQATDVEPDQVKGYLRIASVYMDEGLPGEALRHIHIALSKVPASAEANVSLGDWHWASVDQAQLEGARLAFEQDLAAASRDQLLTIREAVDNLAAGHVEAAYDDFEEAIASDPESVLPYVAMGQDYRLIAGQQAAEASYRRAADFSAGDPEGLLSLGGLYQAEGRYGEAGTSYQLASNTFPGLAEMKIAIGDWYRSQGLHDQALASYQAARALAAGEVESYLRLADLYFLLAERGEAYAVLAEGARFGLSASAVACGPGPLPSAPAGATDGRSPIESRQLDSWQCRWNDRPWSR